MRCYLNHGTVLLQLKCYVPNNSYGLMCIEDPYDVENDVGRSSYGYNSVRKVFEQAYFHLMKVTTGSKAPLNGVR